MARIMSADECLFADARRGRRLSNVVVAAAAAWGLLLLSRLPLLVARASLHGGAGWPSAWGQAPDRGGGSSVGLGGALSFDARLGATSVLLGCLAVLWATVVEGRPVGSFALPRSGAGRAAAVGAALGVGAVLLVLLGAVALAGDVDEAVPGNGATGLAALGGVALAALGWAAQGSAEEIFSRGWLMISLGARYGPWPGVVVSSLLFASFHAFNPGFGWLPAVNLALIGAFFGLLAVWQRCLWGAFAMHAAWNWTLANVLGLTVSGIDAPVAALVDVDVEGPSWLVGGAFGIEGGAATTVVATSGVLGIVWALRRRRA